MSPQLLSIVIAVLAFAAVALVLLGIHAIRARAASPEMEDRLERYGHVTDTTTSSSPKARPGAAIASRLDGAVKDKTFGSQTQAALARADLRITVGEFILIRIGSAVVAFMVGMLVGRGTLAVALVFGTTLAALGWAAPGVYLSSRAKRRQKKFIGQLGETVGLMANSLRAGYSLLQTMELIGREAPAPMSDEFRRVVREVGLGISPQRALNNLLRRIPSEDLDLMVSAINIQHEIGGNLSQILDVIGETIRERVRIKGEISVLTSQQKLTGNVISGLPAVVALGFYVLNPDYMSGLLVWPWICMPIGALVLMVVGWLIMRKIVAIEV
jgi:tight adherence protein B